MAAAEAEAVAEAEAAAVVAAEGEAAAVSDSAVGNRRGWMWRCSQLSHNLSS